MQTRPRQPLVLFCKSYREDLLRAQRLAQSVARFNTDKLPFYMSVPAADLDLFRERCAGLALELLTDEEIIARNPRLDSEIYARLPGGLSQQVVKAEFWRMEITENYLCLDSDCYFLRDFRASDFLAPDGSPYTVMHEAKELLHFAALAGMGKVARDWSAHCENIKQQFERVGRSWDFGPVPVVWSAAVWRDLDARFLAPKGMTFIDAIRAHSGELGWYGEALLAYRSVPLLPVEPLFRCYHYEEQYHFWKRAGETDERVALNYLGVCRQSNWDKDLDRVRRFKFSKLRRRIKRLLTGF
jgi:hypothetical protein